MRVAVLVNAEKPRAIEVAERLSAWLRERRVEPLTTPELSGLVRGAEALPPSRWGDAAFAVVLGGDGTLLQAARQLTPYGVPLLGVNFGHLGFLTELEAAELFTRLPEFLEGRCLVDERSLLGARVLEEGSGPPRLALNDAVVSRVPFSRLLQLEVYADDDPVATYLADGLIVATPTGSTAYSLAAGGPVLDPSLRALVVTPICAYSFGSRPIVVPAERRIRVRLAGPARDVVLTLDGQDSRSLEHGQTVEVSIVEPRVRLLRLPGWNFYSVLRRKWAEGTRA
ncbi:MAG: NAD(+)/NADH kinase [Firmicutes bacterium]|nr:NAD(+)/NADH kinase [Bacillota bacterium]